MLKCNRSLLEFHFLHLEQLRARRHATEDWALLAHHSPLKAISHEFMKGSGKVNPIHQIFFATSGVAVIWAFFLIISLIEFLPLYCVARKPLAKIYNLFVPLPFAIYSRLILVNFMQTNNIIENLSVNLNNILSLFYYVYFLFTKCHKLPTVLN